MIAITGHWQSVSDLGPDLAKYLWLMRDTYIVALNYTPERARHRQLCGRFTWFLGLEGLDGHVPIP